MGRHGGAHGQRRRDAGLRRRLDLARRHGTCLYVCEDATDGAAVWLELGGDGGTVDLGNAVGPILIADDHSTPIVFADFLLTEDEDDLLYADP